ncbi:4-hydroxy-tetrahydrodipicolinate reductase [Anaerotalea alkaliphila]|uniref:4-hydroxy-tetrahydrodipicolinate reductase n=1 Tax=Anaerotalea alkaliphila TaxID=2662126 RepID=A0A7X5HTR7_9FIRM|nr:4-hydroxy-tetrahydrodipicolinate reductase [Anaerotalea alkaliphila]NDL66515.1 4-hydroxy-tetrahydrodipicolinate reductase [Anaerotalea alkaliphila]
MTNIIMHGCNGKMGHVISRLAAADPDVRIVAGIDPNTTAAFGYPVYPTPQDCAQAGVQADVVIDFSIAKAVPALLAFAAQTRIPVVVCTTGLDQAQIQLVQDTAKDTAVLFSANMSLGVNLLVNLVQKAAGVLTGAGFDIEIVEKHHNQKVDAPSGTALYIADSINQALPEHYAYAYDRSKERAKRPVKEIGIHAVRGGTIVGEHDVIFAGQDEILQISHTALSKDIFAVGAVNAAKFLNGKAAGLYNMGHVIG